MVVASDEAGDDDQRVDELVTALRKQAISVYVIGLPAAFGSRESLSGIVEVESFHPVRQGPESLEAEVLNLGGWQSDWKPIDSGFGPFGAEPPGDGHRRAVSGRAAGRRLRSGDHGCLPARLSLAATL